MDSGSVVNILYWGAYQKIRLKRADLCLTTSPLYRFTRESVIPEGTIKLAVTLREAPQTTTTLIDSLMVNCSSAFNKVLRRPLLRTLKVVTSVGFLMKVSIELTLILKITTIYFYTNIFIECVEKSLKLIRNSNKD